MAMVTVTTDSTPLRNRSRIQGKSFLKTSKERYRLTDLHRAVSQISGESSHLYGDGMAMWLTKERAIEGPIHGHTDRFEGLGIIIDTYVP